MFEIEIYLRDARLGGPPFTHSLRLVRHNPPNQSAKERTFSSSLEEEPHDEHLQGSHRDHHQTLNDTEIENPPLRTPNRAEIPVLPCAEVFLVAVDC